MLIAIVSQSPLGTAAKPESIRDALASHHARAARAGMRLSIATIFRPVYFALPE